MKLTARSPKNNMAYLVNVKPNEQVVESSYPNTLRCIMDAFEKLVKYEETGLEPEQIEAQQQEIERLQNTGGLIRTIREQQQEIKQLQAQMAKVLQVMEGFDYRANIKFTMSDCLDVEIKAKELLKGANIDV
jgi:hypothetical protein